MFKPHIGICVCHGKERLIVVKKGYCKIGNDEHKGRTGRTKKVSGKPGILPSKVLRSSITRKTVWVKRKKPLVDKTGDKPTANISKVQKKTGTQEKKKRKPIQYRRKPTGEKEIFEEILAERLQASPEGITCSCCPNWIGQNPSPHNFSHILAKGAYPRLRLDKRNIWICCYDCHHEWDFGDRSQEKFAGKREVADALRQESNLSSS